MTTTDLAASLHNWLESERMLFSNLAQQASLPQAVEIPHACLDSNNFSDSGGGWSVVLRKQSPFNYESLRIQLYQAREKTAPDNTMRTLSQELYNTFKDKAHFKSPLVIVDFFKKPLEWIEYHLLSRLSGRYIRSLQSLDAPDASTRTKLVDDFLNALNSESRRVVTRIAVAGISGQQRTLLCDRVQLRALYREEIEQLIEDASGAWLYGGPQPRDMMRMFVVERGLIEVEELAPKSEQASASLFLNKVILALGLLGIQLHGAGYAQSESFPESMTQPSHFRLHLSDRGKVCDISHECLQRAVDIASRIPDSAMRAPGSRSDVALYRFQQAVLEGNHAESLIDYVIALEAMLLSAGSSSKSYPLRLHGAYFLGSNAEERNAISRDLGEIYKLRNALVHGDGSAFCRKDLSEISAKARELSAKMIVKALEQGWPSEDSLRSAVLRGESTES